MKKSTMTTVAVFGMWGYGLTSIKTVYEAAKKEAKFSFNIQRFAGEVSYHINDEKLLHEMKERKGNAYVQKITLLPEWNSGNETPSVRAKLSKTAIQTTPVNAVYMERNCKLQNSIGNQEIVKVGSRKIVILDVSAIAAIDGMSARAAHAMEKIFYMASIEGKVRVLTRALVNGKDGFVDVSGARDEYGNLPKFVAADLKKAGVKIHSFAGDEGCNPSTPSQGRKTQIACYENTTRADVDLYYASLDSASNGELTLDMKFDEVTPKEAADMNTRVSSHMTAMGMTKAQGCELKTYAILFNADGNTDGRFVYNAEGMARNMFRMRGIEADNDKLEKLAESLVGYLVQSRPYTVKAAGLIESMKTFSLELKGKKLLKINVETADEDLLDAVNTVISKLRRNHAGVKLSKHETFPVELRDYDGVIICHDDSVTEADIEMAGNLNAFKDQYDLKRIDGVNVLAIAHFAGAKGWIQAYLSAQMNKVVLRAIKNAPELQHDALVSYTSIIKRQLDADVDFSAKPRVFGSEMIDTGYVAQVVRDLNPTCIKEFPSVYQSMINDAKLRMEDHINLDRYGVPGHAGMLTSDPIYSVWGESVLNMSNDGVVEVYDPAYCRYVQETGVSDNRGTAIKHPAMGTREILLVRYIDDEEMERRIRALGAKLGKDETETDILVDEMKHFKEGGVLLPADLEKIAWIAAGLDLDGDKAIFHFIDKDGFDVAHIIWAAFEAGKFSPRAVCIGNDNDADTTPIKVDLAMFARMQAKMIGTRNKSVGSITNAFRILVEGLLADTDTVKNFFMDMFREVFKMGTEGNGEYVPQVKKDKTSDGLVYFETNTRILDQVETAIKKAALTWGNIQDALDDLDVVGRHVQELTIDAQKKFYTVMCDFLDALRNRCSITPFEAGITFQMNWKDLNDDAHVTIVENPGYVLDKAGHVKSIGMFSVTKGRGNNAHDVFVLADAFAQFRAWAANAALKRLNAVRAEFVAAVSDPDVQKAWADKVAYYTDGMDYAVKTQLAHVKQMAITANHLYSNFMEELRATYETPNMDKTDLREIEADIRSEARTNFSGILANVANQVRVVAEMNGVDPTSLMFAMANSKDLSSGIIGKLLKEEACYFLAQNSEIQEIRYELRGAFVSSALNRMVENDKVHVENGEVVEIGACVNLMDGEYTIEATDNGVELVRPLTDYIELPKADFSKLSFQVAQNFMNEIEQLPAGAELELRRMKLEKNGRLVDAIGVFYENKVVAEAMCGGFKAGIPAKAQPFNVNAKLYDGKVGKLVGMDITKTDAKGSRFFIVSLDDVKTAKPVETKSQKKTEEFVVHMEDINDFVF